MPMVEIRGKYGEDTTTYKKVKTKAPKKKDDAHEKYMQKLREQEEIERMKKRAEYEKSKMPPEPPPTKEYTPKQLEFMAKTSEFITTARYRYQRRIIDPKKTYIKRDVGIVLTKFGTIDLERTITGEQALSEYDIQYRQYRSDIVGFQRGIKQIPWGYTIKDVGGEYTVQPASPEFIETHKGKLIDYFGTTPTQAKVYGITEKLTGMPRSEQAYISLKYPTAYEQKQYIYGKMSLPHRLAATFSTTAGSVAGLPVTLPSIGYSFFTKKQMPFTTIGPTGGFGFLFGAGLSPLTGMDVGKEWEYMAKYPLETIVATGGEILGGYAAQPVISPVLKPIGRGIRYMGKGLIGSRYIQIPKVAIGKKLFGDIGTKGLVRTVPSKVGEYIPRLGRDVYKGLFGRYTPGGSTYLAGVKATGGIIPKFISTGKYGLKSNVSFLVSGQKTLGVRFIEGVKGIGYRGIDVAKTIKYRKFSFPKLTTTKTPHGILYGTISPGKYFFKPTKNFLLVLYKTKTKLTTGITKPWYHASKASLKSMKSIYDDLLKGRSFTTVSPIDKGFQYITGKGLLSSKTFGISIKEAGTYRSFFRPTLEITSTGKLKPIAALPGISTDKTTTALFKGMTFQQKFFPKGYSMGELGFIDWLESGYKGVVTPSGMRISYFPVIKPPIVTGFKGIAGAMGIAWTGGILSGALFPRFETITGRTPSFDRITRFMTGTLPVSIISKTTISGLGMGTGTIDLQTQNFRQLTKQVTKPEQLFVPMTMTTTMPKIPKYPLMGLPTFPVYGRGVPGFDFGGAGLRYRFREFKLPSINKILKEMKL